MNCVGSWGCFQALILSAVSPDDGFSSQKPQSVRVPLLGGQGAAGGNATGLKAGMLRERGVASEPPGDAVMGGITLHPGKKPQYSSLPSFDVAWRMIN